MSLFLIDDNGFLGDFSTNRGALEMEAVAPPSLMGLLKDGEVDHSTARKIADDVLTIPSLAYLAPLFSRSRGGVILTDGES